ncbi:hypothetical protein OESDEN_13001 [Oesophagostomum dentatum]|uniref:Uncharacterized protein n=1 Tax=Oesophagostomum dentatum TaxID=61180 RepID=A0A0B1SVM7_OESDE|nr:hypothetical protein OESDEN_13001 [Oesophagostomum dentatum]
MRKGPRTTAVVIDHRKSVFNLLYRFIYCVSDNPQCLLQEVSRMLRCLLVFGSLGAVVNFPEGYSNSYPNTSYKSFQTMINDSYIRRGDEVRHFSFSRFFFHLY